MADHPSTLHELQLIKQRDLSEQATDVLNALALVVQPGASQGAVEAARQLDSSCPPLAQAKDAGDYIWVVWDIILAAAGSPDVEDEVQWRLLHVMKELRLCAKGELDLGWGVSTLPTLNHDTEQTHLSD
jgi:hypothetical protein